MKMTTMLSIATATILLTACGGGGGGGDTSVVNATTYYTLAIPLQKDPQEYLCVNDTDTASIESSGYYISMSWLGSEAECNTEGQKWLDRYNRPNDAPATPEQQEGFDYINSIRNAMGMVELRYDARLEEATRLHQLYLVDAYNQYGVNMAHTEDNITYPSVYYRGVQPSDRAEVQGFNGYAGDVISYNDATVKASFDALLTAIYHRVFMLQFDHRKIGVGYPQSELAPSASFYGNAQLFGEEADDGSFNLAISPTVATYPYDGQIDVQRSFFYGESPDPLVGSGLTLPTGNPIHIQFNPNFVSGIAMQSFKLYKEADGSEIDSYILTKQNDPNQFWVITDNVFVLFPKAPLEANTEYRAEFQYSDGNGDVKTKVWRFTTGQD